MAIEAEQLNQPPVNSPARPYGEQIQLDRLRQQFPDQAGGPGGPASTPDQAPPARPLPAFNPSQPQAGPAPQGRAPQGVPVPLIAPGNGQAAGPGQGLAPPQVQLTAQQRRIQIVDALANDPNVSEATRELAARLSRAFITNQS